MLLELWLLMPKPWAPTVLTLKALRTVLYTPYTVKMYQILPKEPVASGINPVKLKGMPQEYSNSSKNRDEFESSL